MTPEEFIEEIRRVVEKGAIEGTISLLEAPPGRRPPRSLLDASAWFCGLSPSDRVQAEQVIGIVAHQALFGLLAVLDGVRAVDHGREKGRFVLVYRAGGQDTVINPEDGAMLHDLLNVEDR